MKQITFLMKKERLANDVSLTGELQGLVMYGIECRDVCRMLLDRRGGTNE